MLTLNKIIKIFSKGETPKGTEFADTWRSFWHKSEKLPIEQILGLAEEIARVSTNFKGYHTNEAALKAAYPKADNKKDFFAWVGSKPTLVWKVFANGADWENTGDEPTEQEIDLAEYAKKEIANSEVLYVPKGTSVEDLSNKATINLSSNGETYASQNKARENILPKNREQNQSITYRVPLHDIEELEVTDFTTIPNKMLKYTGVEEDRADGDIYVVKIPDGQKQVKLRVSTSNYDTGGAFYDTDGKYISGYVIRPTQATSGDFQTLDIPSGAKEIRNSYLKTTIPKFEKVFFYNIKDTGEIRTIAEKFVSNDVASWLSDDSWTILYDSNDNGGLRAIREKKSHVIKKVNDYYLANRSINATNGSITIDNSRAIGIVYMYPVKSGATCVVNLNVPASLGASQDVINIYTRGADMKHARIATMGYQDDNVYTVFNDRNENVYLSFYVELTGSSVVPDFFVLDETSVIERGNGKNEIFNDKETIIKDIDELAYFDIVLRQGDLTKTLKKYTLENKTISPNGAVGVGTQKIIAFLPLEKNTDYNILGMKNTWGNKLPFAFLYLENTEGKNAARKLESDMLQDGSLVFNSGQCTYISFILAYTGNEHPHFDSSNDIAILFIEEHIEGLKDEQGNRINISSDKGINLSDEKELQLPMPTSLARMYLSVDALPAFKGDKRKGKVLVDFMNGISFDKKMEIDIQGATTANDPTYLQKNYTIGFLNDDDSDCDIKIGNLAFDNKTQMKAWWTDSTYLRDPMCNQLVSDYDYTKPYGEQKPYSKYYDGYETGAQCVSIGIPFEMYVNNQWWGLYSWVQRFKRGNWNIEKGNPNHIMMKSGSSEIPMTAESIQVNDEYWEFENPTLDDAARAKVMRLFDFLRTSNSATYKAELHNYMDIDSVLEYFIYVDAFQLVDNFWGNLVLVSYDGLIFYARFRDGDRSFGIGFSDTTFLNPTTPLNQEEKYAKSIWFPKLWTAFQDELKVKFAEMYDKVLNVEHVAKRFTEAENIFGADKLNDSLKKWNTRPANIEGYKTSSKQVIEYYRQRMVYLKNKYGYEN